MKLLSYAGLKQVKGIVYSRVHINRLIKAGEFPAPIRMGGGSVAWVEEEIDAWIRDRIKERDAA